jgi:uncharacterized membrane protein YfcA
MTHLLLLLGAGLLAGAMNALAGGGSFVTLPALIAAGLPSVQANASSTVALWPGGAASAWTYHDGHHPICGVATAPMLAVTLAGGLAGSLLLLHTGTAQFDAILPWLLLLATLALAFGRRIGAALQGRLQGRAAPVLAVQLALGIYGGYFGGVVGLMMMAAWSLLGASDLARMNAPRTLMVSAANTVAVAAFILAGAVRWAPTLAMLAGGLAGGIAGARLGRRLAPGRVRALTLCWTAAVTAAFFWRAYIRRAGAT